MDLQDDGLVPSFSYHKENSSFELFLHGEKCLNVSRTRSRLKIPRGRVSFNFVSVFSFEFKVCVDDGFRSEQSIRKQSLFKI